MRAIRVFAAVVACLALLAVAAGWHGYRWYRAPGPAVSAVTIVFAHGETLHGIADQLASAGIVTHPLWFYLAAEMTRGAGDLEAGEYAFPAAASPEAALALLRSGKTVVHRLVVPEGLSTAEVLDLVDHAEALDGAVTETPVEGEMRPQTYFYSYGEHRQALVNRMRDAMRRLTDQLWEDRRPDLPLSSPVDAVTLASIVEKETAIPAERPKIAAVFYNRLKLGMKLQSDPTVVYAITGGRSPLGHRLDHDDLAADSPYNTYKVNGLPPGPIDNPGRASIMAVLHPDDTDALYFVADGSGGHAFAVSLDAHNKNVARWRDRNSEPIPTPPRKPR